MILHGQLLDQAALMGVLNTILAMCRSGGRSAMAVEDLLVIQENDLWRIP